MMLMNDFLNVLNIVSLILAALATSVSMIACVLLDSFLPAPARESVSQPGVPSARNRDTCLMVYQGRALLGTAATNLNLLIDVALSFPIRLMVIRLFFIFLSEKEFAVT